MMSGSSSGRVLRRLALVLPFLAGVLSGCEADPRYPDYLEYLPRTDPLVVDPPKVEPWTPDNPGQIEQAIARIGVSEDKGGVGGKSLDPKQLPADVRNKVQAELKKVFNTPRLPRVEVQDAEAKENAARLLAVESLTVNKTLYEGSTLYRRHCLHCHGLDGDGRGPTGPWLNPHPRDYRQGLFKFISTDSKIKNRKPRREDLLRTLREGVDGTSMPSFGLQSEQELNQIISYVIHLSLRGQVEFDTLRALFEAKDSQGKIDEGSLEPDGTIGGYVRARLGEILKSWTASDKPNVPPAYPYPETKEALDASIQRGYDLFSNKKNPLTSGVCIGCHIDFGRQVPYKYDAWGTLVRPANLTAGVYRGGRRPIDLYWRIRGGIPPAAMPESNIQGNEGSKTDPYWDLVNFLQALPYRHMLPEDVRGKIYLDPAAHPSAHASAQ